MILHRVKYLSSYPTFGPRRRSQRCLALDMLRFDGRVAVVTGAGGGLGRVYALQLASRGACVVVNDLGTAPNSNLRAADIVVAEIRRSGGTAIADYHSVTDGDAIIKTAEKEFGRVDVLVCNAGILRDVSFAKMEDAAWDAVLQVHLNGTYKCVRAAWNGMRDRGYGRIVFVSSSSGIYGNFGQANYGAAKLGIVGLANTLAREGEKKGVLVNTIAPIATSRMTEALFPPELAAALKPEAVAPLVAVLCHDSCPSNGGLFELGAGWMSALRWQRSKGAWLGAAEAGWTPEAVLSHWSELMDFSPGVASHPDSNTSAFSEIARLGAASGPSDAAPAHPSSSPPSSTDAWLPRLPGGTRGVSSSVDVPAALAFPFPPVTSAYTHRDAILYALSVGASADPSSAARAGAGADESPFTYELAQAGFRVLPTLPVLWPHAVMAPLTEMTPLRFNPMLLLHGEQEVLLPSGALPASATVISTGKIANIYDKGSGAVVVFDTVSREASSDRVLAVNRTSLFIRGVGGFGGDRGPAPTPWLPPGASHHADGTVNLPTPTAIDAYTTPPSLALLYRLNGDYNPLHADHDFAAAGGFDRPILHGLASFGVAGRLLLGRYGAGDAARLRSIRGRFSKHVFPGETLLVESWSSRDLAGKKGAQRVFFQVRIAERNADFALTGGVAEFGPCELNGRARL